MNIELYFWKKKDDCWVEQRASVYNMEANDTDSVDPERKEEMFWVRKEEKRVKKC